jgi:hypothetical protein
MMDNGRQKIGGADMRRLRCRRASSLNFRHQARLESLSRDVSRHQKTPAICVARRSVAGGNHAAVAQELQRKTAWFENGRFKIRMRAPEDCRSAQTASDRSSRAAKRDASNIH